MMRIVCQSLLIVAMLASSLLGPAWVVAEVQHSHEGLAGHCHGHSHNHSSPAHRHGDDHGHHHDHGGHHDHDVPHQEPGEDDGETDPLSHSHHVVIGIDLPIAICGQFPSEIFARPEAGRLGSRGDRCPEGPFFKLIKPPQLG